MSNTLIEIEKRYEGISYEVLFKEHSKLIFKLINNFVKAKNLLLHNNEVDDIYQEIALKIFKNDYLSKYNTEKSSFITWLNIICRTTTIDYYRKRMRWMESVLEESETPDTEGSKDPAMFSLPTGVLTERQEQVITLLFKEGLVPGEVADALNITARTVRSIKFQALERLRNYYGAANALHTFEEPTERRKVS